MRPAVMGWKRQEKMNDFEEYSEVIPGFRDFMDSLRRPMPVHLRINRLKADPESVLEILAEKGIGFEKSIGTNDTLYSVSNLDSPGNLLEYFLGHIHPQALSSCLPPIVLAPKAGSYVLDMCASPGGKTCQLAELMGNTGMVIANELYGSRHVPLAHTLGRLGVLNAVLTDYQAQEFPLRNPFDRILADVPCSGQGRYRIGGKAPLYKGGKGKYNQTDLQKKIILRAFDLLKPGGEMVYSTCTYNPQENEAVVDFLLKNRDAEVLPIHTGLDTEPGIREWRHESYGRDLQRTVRIYPHKVDTVGFFMARMGRRP